MEKRVLIGQHYHRPALRKGAMHCDVWHTMDTEQALHWLDIETAPGVYDRTNLDIAVAFGRPLIMCVYGTPTFYASDKAVNAYGHPGGGSVPIDLPALRRFVRWVEANYGQYIAAWESGNEPREYVIPWRGWDAVAAVHQAIQDALPHRIVYCPGMLAGHPEHWADFLAACKVPPRGFAVHAYNHHAPKLAALLAAIRVVLEPYGRDMPILISEFGVIFAEAGPVNESPWLRLTPEQQGVEFLRCLDVARGLGVWALCWYSADDNRGIVLASDAVPALGTAIASAAETKEPWRRSEAATLLAGVAASATDATARKVLARGKALLDELYPGVAK